MVNEPKKIVSRNSSEQDWAKKQISDTLKWSGHFYKCSNKLICQAAKLCANNPSIFANTIQLVDKYDHDPKTQWNSTTRAPERFRFDPLKGLYKAHIPILDLAGMATNILSEIDKPYVERELKKISDEHEGELVSETIASKLSYLLTQRALENRSKRKAISGEWLVYAKTSYTNIYLCIGHHKERDMKIFKRAQNAMQEYPFSFGI